MSWLILFLAGILEVAWAVGLKCHDGKPILVTATSIAAVLSVILLGLAMRNIQLSTAYVVWTGIGIVGTFIVGAAIFGETINTAKLVWTALIVVGIIGLKMSAST